MPRKDPATRRLAPLRKIVDRVETQIGERADGSPIMLPYELLECGHRQPPRQDIIGETNAYRRRCYRCAKEAKRAELMRQIGGQT